MITFKLPPWARALIYLGNVLGTPVVIYLRTKNVIGDAELVLWGAEVTAAFALAGLKTPLAESQG